jgi:hypothetical protein
MVKLTKEDKRWRAEDDARTLASANVILEDKPRLSLAKKAAVRMAEEERDRAKAMTKVATTKKVVSGDNESNPKRTVRKRKSSPKKTSHNVFQKI